MKPLDENDYKNLAKELGVEVAALKAVQSVESGKSNGFLPDNRPVILFEGHVFCKFLLQKYGKSRVRTMMNKYPTIIYPYWTKKYYIGGVLEHNRLSTAANIDRELALQSASYGMFQIMGFNYKLCGCSSIQDYVNKMYQSNYEQLRCFGNFLKNSGILPYLVKKDWANFAYRYNGAGYKQNQYDVKLRKAYEKFSKA